MANIFRTQSVFFKFWTLSLNNIFVLSQPKISRFRHIFQIQIKLICWWNIFDFITDFFRVNVFFFMETFWLEIWSYKYLMKYGELKKKFFQLNLLIFCFRRFRFKRFKIQKNSFSREKKSHINRKHFINKIFF